MVIEKKVYFAGLMIWTETGTPKGFELVRPSESPFPYLTHNKNGLKHTSHHACLYELSRDLKTATLIDRRETEEFGPAPSEIKLTEKQQENIREAIKNGKFYES